MQYILSATLLLVVLSGIYMTSLYGYLLFHGLAEAFSVVIACGLFMVVWNARRLLQNHYLLFIGIAYLYVGGIDFLHLLAYKGMGAFEGYGANLPTQLWIVGRYLQAFSLLSATIFLHRKLSPRRTLVAYGLSTGLLLASIFYWKVFPDCFREGIGLTPFKIYSEYVICLILLAAIELLIRNSKEFDRHVLILLIASIAAAIAQELAFTTYLSVYGLSNMIGHFLKIVSFYLLYKAIIQTSLVSPWNLLFRNLKQSEVKYRTLFENMTEEVHFWQLVRDETGRIKTWRLVDANPPTLKTWGRTGLEEIKDKTTDEIFGPGAAEHYRPVVQKIMTEGVPYSFEDYFPNLDKYFRFTSVPLGEYFITTGADITQIKKAQAALRESEHEKSLILDNANEIIIYHDKDNNLIWANRAYLDATGLRLSELKGKKCYACWGLEKICNNCPVTNAIATGKPQAAELTPESQPSWPDGQGAWHVRAAPVKDSAGNIIGAIEVAHDITERKRAEQALREREERLRASLDEKEVLLKEIHHRVKNNMQVISSLIALQADNLQDPAMRNVLLDVTHRVRSMAMVHEKLYQSADLARIELAEYVRGLLNYLWRAHGTVASGVRLALDLEPVSLPVNAALPCGLILNELVGNALKHAFRGRAGGEVTVSLRSGPPDRVRLSVRDNGTGLPPGLDWRQGRSLGLRLVQMLAGQLHAAVEVSNSGGTEFTITFGGPKT
jgi:PAS domain S-box-containing protein